MSRVSNFQEQQIYWEVSDNNNQLTKMILTGDHLLSQLIGAKEGKPHRSQLTMIMRCLLMIQLLNKLNLRQDPDQI